MATTTDGEIPPDVLDRMVCTVDFWMQPGSEEKQLAVRALQVYERSTGTHVEPRLRQDMCELYVNCIPGSCERLLTGAQRHALERCASGEAYTVLDD